MNASSPPTNSKQWLEQATATLRRAGIPSARLDAQLLLAEVLGKEKTWLLAHPEHSLTQPELIKLSRYLERRSNREPLAYIRGYTEFYGRKFTVSPDVLIPRPETETIVETLHRLPPPGKLVDVGTGSGCIAITAKLEFPELEVFGVDINPEALAVARQNATQLRAAVEFKIGDLLDGFPFTVDVITANLPYVDEQWTRSPETAFEPDGALFAGQGGLELIKELLTQIPSCLKPGGYVLLEADPRQHTQLQELGKAAGLTPVATEGFICTLRGQL